tara:strand:+ start:464 stop:1588 length:1125 start_codon:yes stop_codon:yes gene_type:complete
MATSAGPEIVTDNLVFGYDTGYPIADNTTSTRFYKGKPTTNLLTQTGALSLDTRSDIYSNTTKTDLGGGKYRFVNDGTGASTIRLYANLNDLTNGNTYGSSLSYEQFTGTSFSIDWCDSSTTAFSKSTYGTANRVKMSGARSTYTSTFRFMDINLPLNSSIVLFDAQIEEGVSSPFTSTSRSSTQGLLDLKETTDIDVDDVSFDSNAQLSFDGTDDHITINNPDISADSFTIQMVVKPDSYSNNPMLINPNSTGIDQYIRIWSNGQIGGVFVAAADTSGDTCKSSTQLSTSEYTHFTITKSPSAIKVYINGNLETTVTPTVSAAAWTGTWDIGQRANNTYNYNGAMPILKVYNTPLTADEVKINFNSIKKRFGI